MVWYERSLPTGSALQDMRAPGCWTYRRYGLYDSERRISCPFELDHSLVYLRHVLPYRLTGEKAGRGRVQGNVTAV